MIKIHGNKAYALAHYYNPETKVTDEIILNIVSEDGDCDTDIVCEDEPVVRPPRNSHKDFETFTEKGKEFIKLWNEQDRDGAVQIVAEHFNISIPTAYRIRKKLGLVDLHSRDHPGKRELYKRIKRLYYEHQSTQRVANIVGMCSQRVNQILREQNVELGPQHITNVMSITPTNGMSVKEFIRQIKALHYEGYTIKQMADRLGVDQGTISKRVKILGLKVKQNHQKVYGGYGCLWCGTIMEHVWIARGPRQQRFCSSKCKNMAKDYRRYVNGQDRIIQFEKYIQKVWGKDWKIKKEEILGRKK